METKEKNVDLATQPTANKKKPVKKSNWQKRLEEAQKQQAKLQQQRR